MFLLVLTISTYNCFPTVVVYVREKNIAKGRLRL